MTILNRKRWVGLLILAAVALVVTTGAVNGIKWAFASLGMIVLIGMTGICIYTLVKVLRHSDTSPKVDRLECGNTSAASFDGDDLKHVTYNKPIEAGSISKKDERIIMAHVDELFKITQEQGQENPAEVKPISKQDKKEIMVHIDELFKITQEQGQENPAEAGPISKQDKKIIMAHIDELFKITREQSQENPAEAGRISKQDKKIIMEHVDELFAKGLGQSEVQPS